MLAVAAALLAQGQGPSEPVAPRPAPEIGFVHVEANVDAAAGGHAGLRVGSHVYHFLQSDGGVLQLCRAEWPAFRHVYAGLQNRSLFVYTLELAPDDAARIAAHAAAAWIEQRRELERVRRLEADAAWWAALRDGALAPPLAGLGLLADEGAGEGAPGRALRVVLRERLGDDFAAQRLSRLAPLIDEAARAAPSLLVLRERLTEREVVRAIERAAPLAAQAASDTGDDDGAPLSEPERCSLDRLRAHLASSVADLWSSPRPDRGRALAVAVARHHAVARSLAEGSLLLLDAFPDDARIVEPDADEAQLAYAPLHAWARASLATLRAAVLDGDLPTEQEYGLLEESAARTREALRGARGEPVRLASGRLLPSRGRAVALPDGLHGVDAADAAARSDAALRDADAAYRARYDYDLFQRNCATELVRLINCAFADEADARRALGALLDPGEGFAFVPWVLAREVRSGLRLREVLVVRSHMRAATDALERDGASAWARWRETTTLTSTLYAPREADGWFLLFTDETVWNRPVYGAINAAYGLARGGLGVLTLPFGGGRDVVAGLHGAFFSLPELFFFNVRKGSLAYVEPQEPVEARE
jgi:hypothetical protein